MQCIIRNVSRDRRHFYQFEIHCYLIHFTIWSQLTLKTTKGFQWRSDANKLKLIYFNFHIANESDFIRPSSDGTNYGMVMSVRPSESPSVSHSFTHFSPSCFHILSWNFAYVECRQFVSIFVGVMPLLEFRIVEIHSFQYFSATCFEIWAETLHLILLYCSTDQVRVSSICVNFCWSYATFGTWILEIHSFTHFSATCFDILSWNFAITLFHCTIEQLRMSSIWVNYTPRNEVRGVYWNHPVRPSVRLSVRLSVDARLGKMVSRA